MKHKEYNLQVAVARVLDASGLLWCHVPNERQGGKAGAHLKRMGVKSGVPDCLIFGHTQTGEVGLALELKTAKGRVSPTQKDWLAKLEERGWKCEVARTTEEALQILSACFGDRIYMREGHG